MVATRDFSGLLSSACALASAAAMVPIDSLDRCIAALHAQDIKAHRARFGALGSDPVPDCLLGVLRHEPLELRLGGLVLEIGLARAPEHAGEFRPGVGRAHIDDTDRFNARPWRLGAEEARGLAALDTAPELLFRGQEDVL